MTQMLDVEPPSPAKGYLAAARGPARRAPRAGTHSGEGRAQRRPRHHPPASSRSSDDHPPVRGGGRSRCGSIIRPSRSRTSSMYPIQIPPDHRLHPPGRVDAGVAPIPFSATLMVAELRAHPAVLMERFGTAGLRGILGWAMVAPVVVGLGLRRAGARPAHRFAASGDARPHRQPLSAGRPAWAQWTVGSKARPAARARAAGSPGWRAAADSGPARRRTRAGTGARRRRGRATGSSAFTNTSAGTSGLMTRTCGPSAARPMAAITSRRARLDLRGVSGRVGEGATAASR